MARLSAILMWLPTLAALWFVCGIAYLLFFGRILSSGLDVVDIYLSLGSLACGIFDFFLGRLNPKQYLFLAICITCVFLLQILLIWFNFERVGFKIS